MNWTASRKLKLRLDCMYSWMVMDIHCPEISWARGSSSAMLPILAGRKRAVETSRPLRWSRTSGCGYYKEHIIPAFRRVAPLPRVIRFHIHSYLPIKAVQFTILSIIAMGYKPAVAYYRSECYRCCWPISITQQLIKRYSMIYQWKKNRKIMRDMK